MREKVKDKIIQLLPGVVADHVQRFSGKGDRIGREGNVKPQIFREGDKNKHTRINVQIYTALCRIYRECNRGRSWTTVRRPYIRWMTVHLV